MLLKSSSKFFGTDSAQKGYVKNPHLESLYNPRFQSGFISKREYSAPDMLLADLSVCMIVWWSNLIL
jgi:hypothetical protein